MKEIAKSSAEFFCIALSSALVLTNAGCKPSPSTPNDVAPRPALVSVNIVSQQRVQASLSMNGSIEATASARISALESGRIVWIGLSVGQSVRKGQALLRLDPEQALTQLAKAQEAEKVAASNAELAQTTAERYSALERSGDIAKQLSDQQQAQAATAKLNQASAGQDMTSAQISLRDAVIRSPIDGFVSEKLSNLGETVSAGAALATVVSTKQVKATLAVPEGAAGVLREGLAVRATLPSFPERQFHGVLHTIAPTLEASTRTRNVEVLFDNPDGVLRPGMFAEIQLDLARTTAVLTVPTSDVISDPVTHDPQVLLVEDDGKVRVLLVKTGGQVNGQLEISAPALYAGQRVVGRPNTSLRDGSPVVEIR